MDPRAGCLAGGKEAREGRRSAGVGMYAPHRVMRCRVNRHRLLGQIHAVAQAGLVYARKTPRDKFGVQMPQVQVDGAGCAVKLGNDGTRDDIT